MFPKPKYLILKIKSAKKKRLVGSELYQIMILTSGDTVKIRIFTGRISAHSSQDLSTQNFLCHNYNEMPLLLLSLSQIPPGNWVAGYVN